MDGEAFRKTMSTCDYVDASTKLQDAFNEFSEEARKITTKLNKEYLQQEDIYRLFVELTDGRVGKNFRLFPPFYTECGKNILVGNDVFINAGCCFQDQGGIEIGDGTFIGHNVVIATLNHDLQCDKRCNMIPKKVKIGKGVWIGSNATICPGVEIGDYSVIGAGAVVTKDIPEKVVAVGVPAKIIKEIL